MTWLKTLAETYDVHAALAGVDKNDQAVLLPISHSTFNAQIEVTVDGDGNFRGSKKLDKGKDVITIIPVTEDSAARGNGNFPHALCDKLCYIAGDYTRYTGDNKEEYFENYMKQLQEWVESDNSHPMIQAVYQYLSKKSLIQDLVINNTLKLDEGGRLTGKIKIQEIGQTAANVRFIVRGNIRPQEVWKNSELYEKYIAYYRKKLGKKLCYATGKIESCSDKHPAKIRNAADKAKLISGNDELGFTYRGRFTSKEQAVSVGYEISQKAHNALRWLIQKQGYTRDGSAIVSWIVNRDMLLPNIMKDSINAYQDIDGFDLDFENVDLFEFPIAPKHETGKYFAQQFNNAINGYVSKIKIDDRVAVIVLDAATTGRLSIVYYDELGGKQYMDAILNWQQHCKWQRVVKLEMKAMEESGKRIVECTPSPRDMALAAFGVQRSEWLEADSKLIRDTIKRLLPCITQRGINIPYDIIRAAAQRASMPQAMNDFVWYNDVLCVVCAMIRFNYEEGGKEMDHFLEDNVNDRNVLFGRLLAIYDYMEQRAMFEFDENGKVKERRATNARRYWNAYSSRPAKTAKLIKQNLIVYEKKLKDFDQMKFEQWTGEIMVHLAESGFDNTALSEMYLPGYYKQMEYMKNSFKNENN